MLYTLLYPFHTEFSVLNVLRYPSFRVIMAMLTALIMSLALYPAMIRRLQVFKFGQVIRKDGPEAHLKKQGTPTMGGILILLVIFFSTVLWADARHRGTWVLLFVTLGYGAVGLYDDYKKVKFKSTDGLAGRWKLFWQLIIGGIGIAVWATGNADIPFSTAITFPFVDVNTFSMNLPTPLYLGFALVILVVGTSNAVNLTDGLDGLAIGPIIVSAFVFLILAYAAGTTLRDFNIAAYLRITHVEGAAELTVFCAAVMGAGIGFLWYNSYPALIFMGDVGSLALGGALGMLAVLTKNELLSAILHGGFLAETLSVIIQVLWFKKTGKRVFLMAPVHHHFEKLGWPEPRVIIRFWIISVALALLALASLKLR
ncbi:MAG: phospho-N-acetylmuramoyl-pentapeptide-transferase [Deltaproteobacteria bacterium]|nr:phospho-N-acetylmuramoyl-pentapeptide-transferase [Deltaproteobacteria bacterium]